MQKRKAGDTEWPVRTSQPWTLTGSLSSHYSDRPASPGNSLMPEPGAWEATPQGLLPVTLLQGASVRSRKGA